MRSSVLLALMACSAVALPAQSPARETRTVTFRSSADGSEQPYALYVPAALDQASKHPLLISLHAEETSQLANLAQLFGVPGSPGVPSLPPGFGPKPLDWQLIVASPYGRGTMGFQGIAEQDVYDVLEDVKRRYAIDENRIYLTGISMGGGGALRLALTRPDIWAAVAPVCPAANPGDEELAPNALNLPIRLFHGEMDPLIPASSSRAWQRRLLEAGAPAEYLEYPGVRHNAWNPAYRDGAFLEWLLAQRRNPNPDRVHLVTRSYRYGSAYWMRIDWLTPGVLASVDARRTGRNAIRVDTRDVDAFTVAAPALDLPGSITIDGATLRLNPGSPLSFVRKGGRWTAGVVIPQGKRLGLEGPVSAAISSGHIYVYGTAGNPSESELAVRRAVAEQAANWSGGRTRVALPLPVKADVDVGAPELDSANLVLFGTRETNLLIRRFADWLPLALVPGAADFGLLFVAPQGNRLLLVSSGLPWWTGADAAGRASYPFVPRQFGLLSSFGDFVLFKGSLDRVVIEGHFDRNWKVPADLSASLLAAGTVTIQK